MAARPLKPPGTPKQDRFTQKSEEDSHILKPDQEKHNFENINQTKANRKSVNSPCSKISVMHLFHEMKQKFPTVPDNVVNQCVWDNFEDREKCIKLLEVELALHPTTAKIYPSQAIRGNSGVRRNSNELSQQNVKFFTDDSCNNSPSSSNSSDYKNLLKPTRPAPVPKQLINCDTVNSVVNLKPLDNQDCLELLKKYQNLSIVSNDEKFMNVNNSFINKDKPMPNRPTTLNLNAPPKIQKPINLNRQKIKHNHKGLKPVRRAPPPPVGGIIQNSSTAQIQGNFHQSIDQILSPHSDSGESEFSINISLSSPASDCSKKSIVPQQLPPRRKISSLSIQPEPAYTRDFCSINPSNTPQSPRSFTSLNLTLRPPTTTPQSPIDITAGPSLTYSSSSYDAKQGYQKQFLITVNDKGGIFSASQIKRPRSCVVSQQHHNDEEFPRNNNSIRQATSEQSVHENTKSLSYSSRNPNVNLRLPRPENAKLVEKQKYRKDKLKKAIEQNKKKLKQIQFEINVLNRSFNKDESRLLDNDIQKLRVDCELMFNKIDYIKSQRSRTVNNLQLHRNQKNTHNKSTGHSPSQITNPITEISNIENNILNEDGPQWSCKYCTFLNDPLMIRCENCDNNRDNSGINSFVTDNTDNNLCVNDSLPNLNNNTANII